MPSSSSAVDGRSPRREEILRSAAGLFAKDGYRVTSMREVAAASGILAGSLYHHFPSKEAIAVELVGDYHADLERAVRASGEPGTDPVGALRAFARDVAGVSRRHRAAVKIGLYDAPVTASEALRTAVRSHPARLDRHWRDLIGAAAGAGALDPRADAGILAHVLGCVTLQVGVMTWERGEPPGGAAAVADCVTSILFDGLAARPAPAAGGEPAAVRAVDEARSRWTAEAAGERGTRPGLIIDSARDLFARRGFEATTIRDIADASGLRAGNLYRYFPSKDAMAGVILSRFSDRLTEAYDAVLTAGPPVAGALEGICWLLNQASRHFSREIDILKGPSRILWRSAGDHYREGAQARYGLLVDLIAGGVADGELSDLADPALVASCVREILWSPMKPLARIPAARVREFCRASVLEGAATAR